MITTHLTKETALAILRVSQNDYEEYRERLSQSRRVRLGDIAAAYEAGAMWREIADALGQPISSASNLITRALRAHGIPPVRPRGPAGPKA